MSEVVRQLLETYAPEQSMPSVDRAQVLRALRMTDRERERYFFESNRKMLELFEAGRR